MAKMFVAKRVCTINRAQILVDLQHGRLYSTHMGRVKNCEYCKCRSLCVGLCKQLTGLDWGA